MIHVWYGQPMPVMCVVRRKGRTSVYQKRRVRIVSCMEALQQCSILVYGIDEFEYNLPILGTALIERQ